MRYLLITLLLSGCTQFGQLQIKAKQIRLDAVNYAEHVNCDLITMDIWREKYGTSEERIKEYTDFCNRGASPNLE